jgi:4'-phosphopantetheinyl transferase EntD
VHHDRVLFCVKESVFKAWHPLTRTWLAFRDASVILHPETGTFTARILVPVPGWLRPALASGFAGRYAVHSGLIVTATTVGHP